MRELLQQALRRAFNLGQTYWQQADSEYTSQHRKADETAAKFDALVTETLDAALAAAPAQPAVLTPATLIWTVLDDTAKQLVNEDVRENVREFLFRAWHHCVLPSLSAAPAQPDEREAFEKWARDEMRGVLKPETRMMLDGDERTAYYADAATAWAWAAWRKARALLATPAGNEIRQLCALKDREALAVNLVRFGGLNKHHARAVADAMLATPAPAQPEPITVAKLAKASDRKMLPIMRALNALGCNVTANQPLDLALIGAALSNAGCLLDAPEEAQRTEGVGGNDAA